MERTTDTQHRPHLALAGDHADDEAAIRAIVADVEAGFNAKDVDRSVTHFAADALVVNAVGAVVRGHHDIEAAHAAGYTGFLAEQYAAYEVTDITFVRPDVAIALKQARATTAIGEPLDLDHAMRAIYVLVKRDARWWIASRGNTLVPR